MLIQAARLHGGGLPVYALFSQSNERDKKKSENFKQTKC
jgi:hypothetical protein